MQQSVHCLTPDCRAAGSKGRPKCYLQGCLVTPRTPKALPAAVADDDCGVSIKSQLPSKCLPLLLNPEQLGTDFTRLDRLEHFVPEETTVHGEQLGRPVIAHSIHQLLERGVRDTTPQPSACVIHPALLVGESILDVCGGAAIQPEMLDAGSLAPGTPRLTYPPKTPRTPRTDLCSRKITRDLRTEDSNNHDCPVVRSR